MPTTSPPCDPPDQEELAAAAVPAMDVLTTQNQTSVSDSEPQSQDQLSLAPKAQKPPVSEQETLGTDQKQHDRQATETVGNQGHVGPEPMALSPPRNNLIVSGNPHLALSRRTTKRKKGPIKGYHRKIAAIEKKFLALMQNFNPIPFVPGKTLDFSKHEEFMKRLGLWDFANTRFDGDIRADLIAQLVASYNPQLRYGFVNDCRIKVSRADLARALKLPGKKSADLGGVGMPEDFVSFMDDFISNWILLHEDTWMMPDEVLNWTRAFKEGNPEKVDWAGLVWFMVEKELAQGAQLVNCYYASHLQQVIKSQKEELFDLKPTDDESMMEDENATDLQMVDCDKSLGDSALDEQNPELTLEKTAAVNAGIADTDQDVGKISELDNTQQINKLNTVEKVVDTNEVEKSDKVVHADNGVEKNDNVADVDKELEKDDEMLDADEVEKKEDADNTKNTDDAATEPHVEDDDGTVLKEESKSEGDLVLQRCTTSDVQANDGIESQDMQGEQLEDDEAKEAEQLRRFDSMQKSPTFDGLPSENLMQGMDDISMPYPADLCDQPSLGLLPTRGEDTEMLDGPSVFGGSTKREICHDGDNLHRVMNDNNKRMRIDGSWVHQKLDFGECMSQLQYWMDKARMAHETVREEACQQANVTQQLLINELGNKEHIIQQLKSKLDELQRRRQAEITRYEKELFCMSNVIDDYRRALKDSQKEFAEYREKCPGLNEPMYVDCGEGGVVKSVMDLERDRLKQEEEKRMMCKMIEGLFMEAEAEFTSKIEEYLASMQVWLTKLSNAEKEAQSLKELLAKRKAPDHISGE